MSEAIDHPPEQRQPTASRTNSDSLQEPKAKKKPRKLAIRNAKASYTPSPLAKDNSIAVDRKESSLDLRVSTLESEYRKLHKRTNSNTVEIGKLQASTRTAPDISTRDRPQEKQDPNPERQEIRQLQVDPTSPSVDQDRISTPKELDRVEELSDEEVEKIPRSTAPAIGEPTEQTKSVALKGSYKIPLPSTLSTEDVRAVQSGLAAASTVAREIATAMRGGHSRNDSVLNENGQVNRATASTKSTSITSKDPDTDVPSSRSWTSLLNSCTKLVANAANAIEMEAAVEAKRNKSLRPERADQQTTNKPADHRTTDAFTPRASTRQRPPTRTNSNPLGWDGRKPTTSLSKPSTRRASSATAPTQSSASKNSTRAMGPLTTQARTRKGPKNLEDVESQRPRTATRMMSS